MIGLYKIDDISANTIVVVIKDAVIRMNLFISSCRGQCYDGASNISGTRSGVTKQLQDDEPLALFMRCYGHALNLAAGDSISKCKVGTTLILNIHLLIILNSKKYIFMQSEKPNIINIVGAKNYVILITYY